MASTHDLRVDTLFSLKGYVCLVTGGGTGIGLMASQVLAANGAKVYITGRRMEALETAAKEHSPDSDESSGSIVPIGPCDVTSKQSLEDLVKQIESKEKYLSLVVAAAGMSGPKSSPDTSDAVQMKKNLWAESPEEWNATYNTDVTAVYFTSVAFLPLLQAAPKTHTSSIIVISSMSGLMRNSQAHFAYNAGREGERQGPQRASRESGKGRGDGNAGDLSDEMRVCEWGDCED